MPLAFAAILVACTSGATPEASVGEPTAAPTATASPAPTETASAEPSASPSEQPAGEVEVLIANARFEPAELTVAAGTEVSFVNEDGYAHTVTEGTDGQPVADPFVDEELPADDTIRVAFDEPGTFDITCIIHPTMQMTITVEE